VIEADTSSGLVKYARVREREDDMKEEVCAFTCRKGKADTHIERGDSGMARDKMDGGRIPISQPKKKKRSQEALAKT
jgi:hypothetical protein